MRLLTGDECGLLKESIPELGRPKRPDEFRGATQQEAFPVTTEGVSRIAPSEPQARSRGVVDMCWLNGDDSKFAALRVTGEIQVWENMEVKERTFGRYRCVDTIGEVFANNKGDPPPPQLPHRPVALRHFSQQNRIAAVDSIGRLSIVNPKSKDVVASYATINTSSTALSYTKGQYTNKDLCTAMDADYLQNRVAVSGRERETQFVDMETGKSVWKAKNLPPDPQTLLQQPVWTTALLFYDSNLLAAGTAYHQVRIYDARTSRRPVLYTPDNHASLEHRVTALCSTNDHTMAVADAAGYLHSFDLRNLGKKKKGADKAWGRFVGPCGSIRQLKKHPSSNVLACVGLDRMLRLFDCTSKKQLDCVYLKQRLNCVLFGQDGPWVEDQDLDVEDDVEDYVDSDNEERSNAKELEKSSTVTGTNGSDDDEDDDDDDDENDANNDDDDDDDENDDNNDDDDNIEHNESGESDDSSDEDDDNSDDEDEKPTTKRRRT